MQSNLAPHKRAQAINLAQRAFMRKEGQIFLPGGGFDERFLYENARTRQ